MSIKGIFQYIGNVICGYYYAKKIIHEYPDSTILLGYAGVGDRVFMLSYVGEFRKRHYIKNIKVISSDPNNIVYRYFGIQEVDLIKMTYRKMSIMNTFFATDFGYRFRLRNHGILPVSIDPYIRRSLYDFNSYMLHSDVIKQIYRIPLDIIPSHFKYDPMGKASQNFFFDNELKIGETILINPYANSCTGIPLSFFQEIADRIRAMGYKVITSLNKKQDALENTYGFRYPLADALDLCSKCGIVIGARSGFMDLISFSTAKIICVDNVEYPHCSLFLLEKCWQQNKNIITYHWSPNNQDKVIGQIVSKVQEYLEG